MPEVEREVENAAGDWLPVHGYMLFVHVPATRPRDQGGGFLVQPVSLSTLFQTDGAADSIFQVDVALDLIRPGRRIRVFEVGHVAVGAGVERVDDHLALDWTGDLDPPALQIGR